MPKSISKKKKSVKTVKKNKQEQKIDSLLTKQILLKEQVEFYKKHSKAKTLIIIFIILVLVLMWLYMMSYGEDWTSELRNTYLDKGMAQAGF